MYVLSCLNIFKQTRETVKMCLCGSTEILVFVLAESSTVRDGGEIKKQVKNGSIYCEGALCMHAVIPYCEGRQTSW